MKVSLAKDVFDLLDQFQSTTTVNDRIYSKDIEGFNTGLLIDMVKIFGARLG